jgi:hypothetical protein
MLGKTAIIPDMMLRHVYRHGEIVSIRNWAIRNGCDYGHALEVAHQLAASGKAIFDPNGRHPATLRRNPNYQPGPQCGLTYQLSLFAIRGGIPNLGGRP